MAMRRDWSGLKLATPSPTRSDSSKRRSSDTARKDRCDIIKMYLLDVGCTRVRGARRRRINDDGDYEAGKLDWDSELIQQELVIPLREFKAIKIDYERRSREKKLTDSTIERDWITQNGQRVPKAKMLKNYYPTNLILHRFFDKVHGGLYGNETVTPHIESQMQSINPFVRCRPLALVGWSGLQGDRLIVYQEQRGRLEPNHLMFSASEPAYAEDVEIDTRELFEHQDSLTRRRPGAPILFNVCYFDDMFEFDLDLSLLDGEACAAMWRSVFKDEKEVELHEFLACFSETIRAPIRYIVTAPFENKSSVSLAEFEALMLWVVGLASHDNWGVCEQLRLLVSELESSRKGSERKEQLALYVREGPRLRKEGDFFLCMAEPGVLALEYMKPSGGDPQRTLLEVQPHAQADGSRGFRYAVMDPLALTPEQHDELTHAVLRLTGATEWAALHQCAAARTFKDPSPVKLQHMLSTPQLGKRPTPLTYSMPDPYEYDYKLPAHGLPPPVHAAGSTRPSTYGVRKRNGTHPRIEDIYGMDDLALGSPLEGPRQMLALSPPMSGATSHESNSPFQHTPYSLRSGSCSFFPSHIRMHSGSQAFNPHDELNATVPLLDDPFPHGDFLVSPTSSFGSLGLSSLAASSPGQHSGRFFIDHSLTGVQYLNIGQPDLMHQPLLVPPPASEIQPMMMSQQQLVGQKRRLE